MDICRHMHGSFERVGKEKVPQLAPEQASGQVNAESGFAA
jgi:hypothetical protein